MINKVFKSSKIGKEILYRVILFSSFITLLLSGFQLYLEFKKDFNQVDEIQQQIDNSYLKSVETAVWGINEDQARALLDGLSALPTVKNARILNEDGSVFVSHNNHLVMNELLYSRKLFSPYDKGKHEIAVLNVYQSHQGAYLALQERLFLVLLANFVKTFLVAAFILFVFHQLVAKHLIDISRYLKDTHWKHRTQPLQLNRPINQSTESDELSTLIDMFNQQSRELQASWKELERNEKRYRELTEGSLQGILLVKSNWEYIYANKQFFRILGYSDKKESLDDTRAYFSNEIASLIESNNQDDSKPVFLEEIQLLKKEGVPIFVQAIVMHSYLDDDPIVQIVVFDISDNKSLREKQKNMELQLIQKNKMVAVGTMLSGVTHEINNPNHLINQNALILSETWESMSEELRAFLIRKPEASYNNLTPEDILSIFPELINDIRIGSERITNIVEDLKSFVRQDETQEIEFYHLNDIINDTVHILRTLINKRCLNFQMDLDASIPAFWCFKQRLSQVVANLLINAIEAIEDSSCLVRISTEKQDDFIILRVYDEGVGIPEQNKENIFEAFFSTKTDTGGTGLGLAICQSIASQHHAEIKINEDVLKGTEFYIEFPLTKQPMKNMLGLR